TASRRWRPTCSRCSGGRTVATQRGWSFRVNIWRPSSLAEHAVETLKLMCILAHPDDESLGTGGTLAKYAAEGIETYLITATRGERGWPGDPAENPGMEGLGKIREKELLGATQILGVRDVHFLDYIDGDL